MNESKERLNDIFFYGLYMDEEILKEKGVTPRNRRVAIASGYKLRIGNMATLLRDKASKAYGLVYSLTHNEIHKLYEGSGLNSYVKEALVVKCVGIEVPVLCCNLLDDPSEDESNQEYYQKLVKCMEKYSLPIPSEI